MVPEGVCSGHLTPTAFRYVDFRSAKRPLGPTSGAAISALPRPRTNGRSLARVDPNLTADEWIGVEGRPPVCRESGCGEPAVDDRQLCCQHGLSHPSARVNMHRGPTPTNMKEDLSLGAKAPPGPNSWMERAACRNALGGAFFVDMYPRRGGAEITAVKAICATCPVSKECLSAGRDEEFGIWGGLTAQERRRLPRPRRQSVD